MKYRLVRKNFPSKEDIEIPDNAVAISYSGMVKISRIEKDYTWLGVRLYTEIIEEKWGYQFEWLEPAE